MPPLLYLLSSLPKSESFALISPTNMIPCTLKIQNDKSPFNDILYPCCEHDIQIHATDLVALSYEQNWTCFHFLFVVTVLQ